VSRLFGILFFVIALAASAQTSELTERLKPWDEAAKDASFLKFRNELKAVIARKDAVSLMKNVAPNVTNSFGGGWGAADFNKSWKPSDPKSPVWRALSIVVELGGNFDNKSTFSAPYVYSAWPDDADPYNYVAVVAPNAVLRAAPKSGAAIVRALDHDLLEVLKSAGKMQHETGPNDWDEVKDAKGKRGFVLASDVRSPVDYRAIFEKRNGKWVIATFIAGD
jgi:hypothetical protein